MANRNYDRGRVLEYRTIKNFEDMGCTAIRSAGSHGLADVIALRQMRLNKSTSTQKGRGGGT